jgi:uncharacterized protein (DUF362 family)
MAIDRRTALKLGLGAAASALTAGAASPGRAEIRVPVALVKAAGADGPARADAVRRALALVGADGVARRHVVIKPNFNSADPFPGSTHPDTLAALVESLGQAGARRITVADRSGMGKTQEVLEALGMIGLGRRLGFEAVALDSLPARDWILKPLPGSHWNRGVTYPRLLEEAEAIVSTCCLKTHRFGGRFTLSLKNSVGAVGSWDTDGYNYMWELHLSLRAQRWMIAEVNTLYQPALVLLDGLEAFVDGGPEVGTRATPGVMLAGRDRVAIDAVGVALLRLHGARGKVAAGRIFEQEQIARAVELGLGVSGPDAIDLVTDDRAGQEVIARLRPLFVG